MAEGQNIPFDVALLVARRVSVVWRLAVATGPPSDIFLVPHDKLRELRVVTDNIWDESWSFEYNEGVGYLRIWQQSYYGENKLLLYCSNGLLGGWAFLARPENLPKLNYTFAIFINGELQIIPEATILPTENRDLFISATFPITRDLARKVLTASSIGAAIQPPNKGIFLGFQIGTAKGHDKLSNIITSCH
jgi:hypothetical protein